MGEMGVPFVGEIRPGCPVGGSDERAGTRADTKRQGTWRAQHGFPRKDCTCARLNYSHVTLPLPPSLRLPPSLHRTVLCILGCRQRTATARTCLRARARRARGARTRRGDGARVMTLTTSSKGALMDPGGCDGGDGSETLTLCSVSVFASGGIALLAEGCCSSESSPSRARPFL